MVLAVSRRPLNAKARVSILGHFPLIVDKVAVEQVGIISVFAIFCSLKCDSVDLACTFQSVG
jgi:hypothetical protein